MPDPGANAMANAAPSGAAGMPMGGAGPSLASNFAGGGPPAPPGQPQMPMGSGPPTPPNTAGGAAKAQDAHPATLAAMMSKNPYAMLIAMAIEDAHRKHQQEPGAHGGGYPVQSGGGIL